MVGESGCGKTSVAMSLLQLQADNAEIISGNIIYDGKDIVSLNEEELRKVRWFGISIVFQGAMNAWNPVVKIQSSYPKEESSQWIRGMKPRLDLFFTKQTVGKILIKSLKRHSSF